MIAQRIHRLHVLLTIVVAIAVVILAIATLLVQQAPAVALSTAVFSLPFLALALFVEHRQARLEALLLRIEEARR